MEHLTFVPFKGKALYNTAGVKVGQIVTEQNVNYVVLSLTGVASALKKILGDECKPDDPTVMEITKAAKQAGILPTFADVVETFLAKEPLENFSPKLSLVFKPCQICVYQILHGHLCYGGENLWQVFNLLDGLNLLDSLVNEKEITPEAGIYLFKQMVEAGLAEDPADFLRRVEAKYPEIQAARELTRDAKRFFKFLNYIISH